MKAVILAGGRGNELQPITDTRPKPMIKLLGKPILQYIIEELKETGINEILIITGYKGEQIRSYFKSGKEFNINIQYADQGNKEGIEHALLAAEVYVQNESKFLLLFGDIISEKGLIKRVLNALENTQAEMAMSLTLQGDTGDFGVVNIDYTGHIKEVGCTIDEKDDSHSHYVDAGCFILNTSIFSEIKKQHSLVKALNSRIAQGDKIIAAIWEKEWIDIGKPWNILEANRMLLSKLTESRIANNVEIEANVVLKNTVIIGENTKISSGTVLNGPVYIGPNSYIGNNALIRNNTAIGANSLIGFGSELKDSVVFEGTKIYRMCYVGDSIVGKGTIMSTGVMTVNTKTPKGKVSVFINNKEVSSGYTKLGAIIGDACELGVNTLIFPGRKIKAGSLLLPGTKVKKDID